MPGFAVHSRAMYRRCLFQPSAGRGILLALAIALPSAASSCALIPLATLGTVADIASSAASTGPEVYQMGKLDLAFVSKFSDVQKAVRQAAYELRLIVIDDPDTTKHPGVWKCQIEDNLTSLMTITVEARTPMLCRCRVDVGLFGSQTTAKLFMSRISLHIPVPPKTPPVTSMPADNDLAN
jgi:hypothetical protein